jgi:uncharacterized membrane protein (UPF0182 family)
LRYVIAVFNQDVAIKPTLAEALSAVLGANISAPSGGGSTKGGGSTSPSKGQTVATYLQQASTDYTNAQAALSAGNLGKYQTDVNAMNAQLQLAQTALAAKS